MSRRRMSSASQVAIVPVPRYRARILDDPRHDPYEVAQKPTTSTRCGDCGAVYQRGRWTWALPPDGAEVTRCPACRRIHDNFPAGVLILDGARTPAFRAELLRLAHHQAERERDEHPMHRIMHVTEHGDRIELATTDIHLPQRIGRAIKRAFRGDLDIDYGDAEYAVRVNWRC